jgi:tripartite-type tricarboxylate transporter receptor subunit TctC
MMKILFALLLALAPFAAAADTYPSKPIRVIVPFAPGGGTDNLVRLISGDLATSLGQQIVVDNRPGGASMIGTDMVAKAAPDGYTVLVSDSSFLVNPGLQKSIQYDTLRDFTGVTMLAAAPVILVTHPSVPAKNLQELLALAKQKPGSLNYASGGTGASTHLAGELLKLVAGVDIVHVPYKGTGPAMIDLLGGVVHMQFAGISSARPHLDAKKLNAIAVTGKGRNAGVPDVPTFAEAGLEGVEADSYWGVYVPAKTPADVVSKLNEVFVKAIRNPAFADRLAQLGYVPIGNGAAEHTAQMKQMIADWAEVIRKAKIQVD